MQFERAALRHSGRVPRLKPGVDLGRKVLQALQMGDGFTHMEWFLTPKGEAVFGAFARKVATIELAGAPKRQYNNVLRAFASLPVRATRA